MGGQNPTGGTEYLQIVLYAAGNALTVGVGAALYGLWTLLSSYQEPLLWAWLVSVALKDTKDWLEAACAHQLMTRSLPGLFLRTLLFPLLVLKDTIHELGLLLSTAVSEERAMQSRVTSSWRRIMSGSSYKAAVAQDDWSDGDDKGSSGVKKPSPEKQAAAADGAKGSSIMEQAWHVTAVLLKFVQAAFAKAWQHRKPSLTTFQAQPSFSAGPPGSPTLMHPLQPYSALMRSASRRYPGGAARGGPAAQDTSAPEHPRALLRSMTTRETRGQGSRRPHHHHLPHMALATPRVMSYTPWGQPPRAPWTGVAGVPEDDELSSDAPLTSRASRLKQETVKKRASPGKDGDGLDSSRPVDDTGLGGAGSASRRLATCLTLQIPRSEASELSDGPDAAGDVQGSGPSRAPRHDADGCTSEDAGPAQSGSNRSRAAGGPPSPSATSTSQDGGGLHSLAADTRSQWDAGELSDELEEEQLEGRASSRLFVWLFRVAVVQQLVLFCMSLDLTTLLLWGSLSLAAISVLFLAEERLDAFVTACKERISTWVTANLAPPPPLPKAMSRRASGRMGPSPSLRATAAGSLRRASNVSSSLSAAPSLERAKATGGLPTDHSLRSSLPTSTGVANKDGVVGKEQVPIQASSWWADGNITVGDPDPGQAAEDSEGQGQLSKRSGKRKHKKKRSVNDEDGVGVASPAQPGPGPAAKAGATQKQPPPQAEAKSSADNKAASEQRTGWGSRRVAAISRSLLQRSRTLRVCVRLFKRLLHGLLMAAWGAVRLTYEAYQQVDVWVRGVLLDNLNEVVSGVLVLGTLLGMVIMSAVLLVQIGSEGHDAVMHVDQLLRNRSASSAVPNTNTSSKTMGLLGLFQGQQRQLTLGVEGLQLKALSMMHSVLPTVVQHSNDLASKVVAKYNLTPVVEDLEKVYFSLPLSLNCSKAQHDQYTTSVARAELQLHAAADSLEAATAAVAGNRTRLDQVMAQWEVLWISGQRSHTTLPDDTGPTPQPPAAHSTPWTWLGGAKGATAAASGGRSTPEEGGGASKADQQALHRLHAELLEVSSALELAVSQQAKAQLELSEAKEVAGLAERKLRACHALNAADAHNPWSKLLTRCLQLVDLLRHADMHLIQQEAKVIYGEAHKLFRSLRGRLAALVPAPHMHGASSCSSSSSTGSISHANLSLSSLIRKASELLPTLTAGLMPAGKLPGNRASETPAGDRNEAIGSCEASDQDSISGGNSVCPEPAIAPSTPSQQQVTSTAGSCSATDASTCKGAASQAALESDNHDGAAVHGLSKAAGEVLQLTQDLGVGEGLGDVVGQLAGTAFSSISGSLAALAGGTTSLAWDTGAALYQAANSVVTFALDFALFICTLLYLLTSGEEPLQRLISLLPLSRQHQDMAGRALSQAMRAVFLSSLKLAFFHAGFTWVTLQAAGTHLTTLLTLSSSLLAVLPVLPVWSPVALPCAELVLCGQYTGAGFLLVLHWVVCAYVDDIIMSEIQPANPYLMGFGVAGGMAVWSNPLKGVLLGPMCLALMSAAYNLHGQLVAIEF